MYEEGLLVSPPLCKHLERRQLGLLTYLCKTVQAMAEETTEYPSSETLLFPEHWILTNVCVT